MVHGFTKKKHFLIVLNWISRCEIEFDSYKEKNYRNYDNKRNDFPVKDVRNSHFESVPAL